MTIVKINLHKMKAERNLDSKGGQIRINNNVAIKDVEEMNSANGAQVRLLQLEKAWAWSAARAWLRRVSNSDTYRRLREERHRLQDRTEKKVDSRP